MRIKSLLIAFCSLGLKCLHTILIKCFSITLEFRKFVHIIFSLTVTLFKNSCIFFHTVIAFARCIVCSTALKWVSIGCTTSGIQLINVLMSLPWKELNALLHFQIDTQKLPHILLSISSNLSIVSIDWPRIKRRKYSISFLVIAWRRWNILNLMLEWVKKVGCKPKCVIPKFEYHTIHNDH